MEFDLSQLVEFCGLFQMLRDKFNKVPSKHLSAKSHVMNIELLMSCVAIGQQQITETEALYVLARRYVELQRYIIYFNFLLGSCIHKTGLDNVTFKYTYYKIHNNSHTAEDVRTVIYVD